MCIVVTRQTLLPGHGGSTQENVRVAATLAACESSVRIIILSHELLVVMGKEHFGSGGGGNGGCELLLFPFFCAV